MPDQTTSKKAARAQNQWRIKVRTKGRTAVVAASFLIDFATSQDLVEQNGTVAFPSLPTQAGALGLQLVLQQMFRKVTKEVFSESWFQPGIFLGVGYSVRSIVLLCVDIALIVLATVAAFLLRENFDISPERAREIAPYILLSALSAAIVVPALGLNRSVWRFSTMTDYLHLVAAAVAIGLAAVLLSFTMNRLDGIARSIPFLQAILIAVLLVSARVYMRVRHAERRRPLLQFEAALGPDGLSKPSVLIVGVNRLTELFLQAAHEANPGEFHVAGLLGHDLRHTGRLMHRYPILGGPEQLPEILNSLGIHGISVARIIVTAKVAGLSDEARNALAAIADKGDVRVEYLTNSLGFEPGGDEAMAPAARPGSASLLAAGSSADDVQASLLEISLEERQALARRLYWRVKRGMDLVAALVLLVLLSPIMVLVSGLALFDVGRPILFWQQRPGLGGRPFRLYKVRTMGDAFDRAGHPLSDAQRVSILGRILRRSRLDELPQLFNILIGQMSFIGPRPLLPVDQPVGYEARLLVRPGLTGWAQVRGGRNLSAQDKVALDIWYVRNASLAVDMQILVHTVAMVIFGEKEHEAALRRAWEDAIASSDDGRVREAERLRLAEVSVVPARARRSRAAA